ncbi:MAG: hypothetical protein HY749_24135 [Gammaproteobacteria bacterium]|nr:hypothetical protein [Gammaproteobacteria bacterium]
MAHVAASLCLAWFVFLGLIAFIYYVTSVGVGTPISPRSEVVMPSMLDGVENATDLPSLKKVCRFLASERDTNAAATSGIVNGMQNALKAAIGLMALIGLATMLASLYLWNSLRNAAPKPNRSPDTTSSGRW